MLAKIKLHQVTGSMARGQPFFRFRSNILLKTVYLKLFESVKVHVTIILRGHSLESDSTRWAAVHIRKYKNVPWRNC